MKSLLTFLFICFVGFLVAQPTIDHWETVVQASQNWKYITPTTEPVGNWRQAPFTDDNWAEGSGGFGYGDGDDETITDTVSTLYLRTYFDIIDTAAIAYAVLSADYDDAFIAYLNGVEIARANIGVRGDLQPFAAPTTYFREAQMYLGGYPEYFELRKDELQQALKEGENVLAIQVHNDNPNSSDLSAIFFLSVGINDNSNYYEPTPEWFSPPVLLTESNLPILVVNTSGQTIVDDPRINANLKIIHHNDGTINQITDPANVYDGNISIEIRGSSSQTRFPKKSYGFETQLANGSNNNISILGLPEENDWILIGPYSDKTLLRNDILYHLSAQMGQYAPRTRLCELVIDQKYQGFYLLVEKIKRDKNRVDISKLKVDDNEGDQLTGGYILKIDKSTGSGGSGWHSPFQPESYADRKLFFQYEYPDIADITLQQQNYIQNFINQMETALSNDDFKDSLSGYRNYMDIPSFINFFFANELSYNVDGYRMSTFLYKDRDSVDNKLHIGPVWDFNLAFGNGWDCRTQNSEGFMVHFHKDCTNNFFQIPFWWERMLEDPWFQDQLRCQWKGYREGPLHTDSIMAYIDQRVITINDAQQRNFTRWPVLPVTLWPNFFHADTYQGEVDLVKDWIKDRMAWLDQNMPGNCNTITNPNRDELTAALYPNPTQVLSVFDYYLPLDSRVNLLLYNAQGQLVSPLLTDIVQGKGFHQFKIPLNNLSPGVYFLTLKAVNEVLTFRLMVY